MPLHDAAWIKAQIPHRDPFLFVDRIMEFEAGVRIVAEHDVTGKEDFFRGHFPGRPVMPGVLIIEALAQTGGILLFASRPELRGQLMYFAAIENARFRRPVLPGDLLRFDVTFTGGRARLVKMTGKAWVGSELAAEANMTAVVAEEKLPG